MSYYTSNFDEMTYEEYVNDDVHNIESNGDVSDGGEYVDYLIENLTREPEKFEVPTEYIDQIVKDEDYMEFADYLERLENEHMIKEVEGYVQFNYPEFFEDVKIANSEKFRSQNGTTGVGISKNFESKNKEFKNSGFPSKRDMFRTNTDLQDVLTW